MSRFRRAVPAVLAVVLAGSGLTVLAAPVHAGAPVPGKGAATGEDPGSDWGDGAVVNSSGRIVTKAARTTTVNPASGPDFEMPFVCGQSWTGSSRSGHSPSYYSIDWNTTNDLGRPAVASAPGVVVTSRTLSGSYGRYVVIDHGNGYSTLYGHLNQLVATVGTHVDQGDLIGYVGSSGNSTGPHLHFEERLNGAYFAPYFHRARFRINSTATSANCADRPVTADWDGNGVTDLGIFRSAAGRGYFYQRAATGKLTRLTWGFSDDKPLTGDFDGDRSGQIGVRQAGAGNWYLRSATGANAKVAGVGSPPDIPVTGDWDGNGRDNLGYYRSGSHMFYLRSDQNTFTVVNLGAAGDLPLVGDWNHDGKDDIGVFRPSTSNWYFRSPSGSSFKLQRITYGAAGDMPVTGDWDGDGTTDVGVWRPSTAQFISRVPTAVAGRYANSVVVLGNHR